MASYNALNHNQNMHSSPYGSGDPYYQQSTGFITPAPLPKKRTSNWVKIGIPVAIVVIAAAVVGGILGARHVSTATSGGSPDAAAAASSAASLKSAVGLYATGTNSKYMVPLYPSTTNTAAFTTPTLISGRSWPSDPFQPSNPSPTSVRSDRPRLFAPSYKWAALPALIESDPYLKAWNDTIFGNATDYYSQPAVQYFMDGSSGILDNARDIKMRIKAFSYVYRMTNDSKWVDRAWIELQNAAGNGTQPFGNSTDRWNNAHFLDSAELTAAFAIAYDWMYEMWDDGKKAAIMSTMIQYGLAPGLSVFTGATSFGWWATTTYGNWNCVCNGGLTVGALAILGDDTTGTAEQLLSYTINNAKTNCANAVTDDGTWHETANYWYFGTTGHAEMSSGLITATGSDYGLLDSNPNFYQTGFYHMYVYGATSLFDYGDTGPNKYSTTANAMFLYGSHYNQPSFILFQRDRPDAAEPWAMFWYDPSVTGAFWDGLPLDRFFDNDLDQWVSMRSSWTDFNGLYVAMKGGKDQGHETHNDLDVGDFVIDALGQRWAGEFGSGDYNSPDYFTSDDQNATRWLYYRKMTEGQNTLLVNKANQNVATLPTNLNHNSSGTTQGSSTVLTIPVDSTAFWTADITSAYFDASSVKRGVRLLNGRKQVLIQDEITATADIQWRMQTNATVTTSGTTATLTLGGETMQVNILNPPSGAAFSTSSATRFSTDPTPPEADQPNAGVTVLIIDLPAGTYTLQVLFNPQWAGMSSADYVTPPSVALGAWTLTSHN